MDFDGIPDAKRPKIDDDNTLPGPPGGGLQRETSIASAGGNKDNDSFPQQLMKMLNDPANAHIVAWTSEGDAFIVHSKDQFVAEVMPVYFGKRSKFTSFTRKLNRWGFARNNQGENKGAYSHPLFHRDDPSSHEKMSCASQPGQGMIRGRGGGKAKRRNSGPMAMSKANARAEAGLMAAASAGEASAAGGGARAGAALAGGGMGLITPQIAHGQLTSQMMFGSQGLTDSAGGFAGLSPFGAHGFTPMAMTPGTLSIAGLTPGGVTGLTPGTLTPGILSGLSPMMQINAAAAAGQDLGAGLGEGAAGGAVGLPPPPPLAGAAADSTNEPTNNSNGTEHSILGNTDVGSQAHTEVIGEQSQNDHSKQPQQQQQQQQQQMGNLAPGNNPFLNLGMQFPGGMMGNFSNAQQFLQMQQQRVQQQLQAQQMQLLQIQRQQAAMANSSNTGSVDGSAAASAAPPNREGGDDDGGDGDLDDLNTGGLGGTGFSPAPPGDNDVHTGPPVGGNDPMNFIQQMQARLNQQQQLLNGSSLQLQAGAIRSAGFGGAMLPAGAEPDPLPAGMNRHGQAESTIHGTTVGPSQFHFQQLAAGGATIGNGPLMQARLLTQATSQGGEAPMPATTSDPAEEQVVDMPNIANNDTAKGALAQPAELAGTTSTPVVDAQ